MDSASLPIGGPVVKSIAVLVFYILTITLMNNPSHFKVVSSDVAVLPLLDLFRGFLVFGLCLAVSLNLCRGLPTLHLDFAFANFWR